jgi:hypothetical protein
MNSQWVARIVATRGGVRVSGDLNTSQRNRPDSRPRTASPMPSIGPPVSAVQELGGGDAVNNTVTTHDGIPPTTSPREPQDIIIAT